MLQALRVPEGEVEFLSSMPRRYHDAFAPTEAHEHSTIVGRRHGAPAHMEICKRLPEGGAVVCIVAEDRPGLLSLISAALLAHELDVLAAKVFTRPASERRPAEAVDFFWIQRSGEHPSALVRADVAGVCDSLTALVTGEATVEAIVRRMRATRPMVRSAFTHVTFAESEGDELTELTVHTSDRPGLLLAIAHALFRAGLQVISSEASTREGRVLDRFVVASLDGSPLVAHSRGLVQAHVLAAIDALARGSLI